MEGTVRTHRCICREVWANQWVVQGLLVASESLPQPSTVNGIQCPPQGCGLSCQGHCSCTEAAPGREPSGWVFWSVGLGPQAPWQERVAGPRLRGPAKNGHCLSTRLRSSLPPGSMSLAGILPHLILKTQTGCRSSQLPSTKGSSTSGRGSDLAVVTQGERGRART